jgi:hypothetical protein
MTDTPTKNQVVEAYGKMKDMFLDGIQEELKSHMSDKHTYMYGKNKSVWRATEKLEISKELAIFILMGSNRRKETWGSLKDAFGLEPLSKTLTPLIVEQCREVSKGHYYRVSFTDRDKLDGNFKLKITMKPMGSKNATGTDSDSEDTDGFTRVKARVPKMNVRGTQSTATSGAPKKPFVKRDSKELTALRARVAALESQLKN